MKRSRILLVEDQLDAREQLRAWLENSGYEVHAVANGVDALGRLRQLPIEVVVTHLRLPGLNGIELLSLVKEIDPRIEVIILSESCTVEDTLGALRGRAFDFLQLPLRDLRQLNRVIGEALLQRCLAHRVPSSGAPGREPLAKAALLTPREEQVLSFLALGWENKRIAEALSLGEKTVRNLLSGIYGKLGVSNLTQALLHFHQGHSEAFPARSRFPAPQGVATETAS